MVSWVSNCPSSGWNAEICEAWLEVRDDLLLACEWCERWSDCGWEVERDLCELYVLLVCDCAVQSVGGWNSAAAAAYRLSPDCCGSVTSRGCHFTLGTSVKSRLACGGTSVQWGYCKGVPVPDRWPQRSSFWNAGCRPLRLQPFGSPGQKTMNVQINSKFNLLNLFSQHYMYQINAVHYWNLQTQGSCRVSGS